MKRILRFLYLVRRLPLAILGVTIFPYFLGTGPTTLATWADGVLKIAAGVAMAFGSILVAIIVFYVGHGVYDFLKLQWEQSKQ